MEPAVPMTSHTPVSSTRATRLEAFPGLSPLLPAPFQNYTFPLTLAFHSRPQSTRFLELLSS